MRYRLLALLTVAVVLVATAVRADDLDERGWHRGTPAANAGVVISGPSEAIDLQLPEKITRHIRRDKPALLVYFSPTCPHCQHAQPELNALSERLGRDAVVIGIAGGRSTREVADLYTREYDVPYPIVLDETRDIGTILGIRSTPSALMVRREGDGYRVMDGWYPYSPGYDVFVEGRVAGDMFAGFREGEFQGTNVCATCHTQEADAYGLSYHSIAWNTLVKQEEQANDECTSCHVTGAGEPTGWDGDPTSHLVNVGCESCHGGGGPHDGSRTEPSSTCESCHDDKHSIAFSYEKGLPLVDHYIGTTMDQAAYREARTALYEGTAPRTLLAFEDGAFVGSDQCQSCHEAEHAWWTDSPHGQAMATLSRQEVVAEHPDAATNVECVACHASPTRSGPPPNELSGYRTDENVGCESCHGPGEKHVAAGGGTDNIQGLGESCPVCVLEAICTSCHTQAWDPEWDLDTRLPAIDHMGSDPN